MVKSITVYPPNQEPLFFERGKNMVETITCKIVQGAYLVEIYFAKGAMKQFVGMPCAIDMGLDEKKKVIIEGK